MMNEKNTSMTTDTLDAMMTDVLDVTDQHEVERIIKRLIQWAGILGFKMELEKSA